MSLVDDYSAGSRAALAVFSKRASVPMLTPAQRAASALIQGGSSLALNLAMAPSGDRMRQAGIGAASDALGGYLGGFKGMGASLATNMGLQALTAPKPPPPPPHDPMQERYAALFKDADHADDRLMQRIKEDLPPGLLKDLREQAKELEVAPGRYYLNVKNKAGKPVAVAAFKTVGKDHQLVLATVLKPKSKPPSGSSLSHLMKQPASK